MIPFNNLLSLQEFDMKIQMLREEIDSKKQKVSRMLGSIKEDSQLLDKKSALLKKIQLRKRTAETQLESLGQNVADVKMKLERSGSNPSAYKALEKEQKILESKIDEIESSVLEDMEKIEKLSADIQKSSKVINGRGEHIEDIKKRVTGEIRELNCKIDELLTQRSQLTLKMDAQALDVYEGLRRKKNTQVVFEVSMPSCPSCGMSLPAGFVNQISSHEDCESCSNCGVLLRWTGMRD